jgi:hypothetical protein
LHHSRRVIVLPRRRLQTGHGKDVPLVWLAAVGRNLQILRNLNRTELVAAKEHSELSETQVLE